MRIYPTTVDEMLKLEDVPVVAIDQESLFTFINKAFTDEYGWTEKDLLGKPVIEIMPKHMRSAHNIGFSRFLTTETSVLLGKPLPLKIRYKNGREELANHIIIGDKENGRWTFSAVIESPEKSA
jgi:PAS domain S-box-containing protein